MTSSAEVMSNHPYNYNPQQTQSQQQMEEPQPTNEFGKSFCQGHPSKQEKRRYDDNHIVELNRIISGFGVVNHNLGSNSNHNGSNTAANGSGIDSVHSGQYSCLGDVTSYHERLKVPPMSSVGGDADVDEEKDEMYMDVEDDDAPMDMNSSSPSTLLHKRSASTIYQEDGRFTKKSNLVQFPKYSSHALASSPNGTVMENSSLTELNGGELRHSLSAPSLAATSTTSDASSQLSQISDSSQGSNSSSISAATDSNDRLDTFLDGGSLHCDSSTRNIGNNVNIPKRNSYSTGNLFQLSLTADAVSGKPARRRRVSLSKSVSIVPIPSRSEYPDVVKQRLWSNPLEMYQNAARNSIEFAYEGWNWRSVYDDEAMIYVADNGDGEMVHPIHFYLKNTGVDMENLSE